MHGEGVDLEGNEITMSCRRFMVFRLRGEQFLIVVFAVFECKHDIFTLLVDRPSFSNLLQSKVRHLITSTDRRSLFYGPQSSGSFM